MHKILALILTMVLPVSAWAQETFDIVINGGRVIDPETGLDAIRNVGVLDNRITAITEEPIEGARTIDATGRIVAPGFIDLHAHGQNLGDYRMQAMQGVTTMLELESGVLPISQWYEEQGKKRLPVNYGAASGWTYARIATFTDTEPEATVAYFQDAQKLTDWKMNVATPEQQEKILGFVEQGLDEGALAGHRHQRRLRPRLWPQGVLRPGRAGRQARRRHLHPRPLRQQPGAQEFVRGRP